MCPFQLPELALFGIIKTSLCDTLYTRNWQDMEGSDLISIQCISEGTYFPSNPLTFDFDTEEGTFKVYDLFIKVCQVMSSDGGTRFAEWSGGQLLIPVMLSQHLPSLRYRTEPKQGLLTCRLRFKNPTTAPLNLYSFGVSSTHLEITRERSVIIP